MGLEQNTQHAQTTILKSDVTRSAPTAFVIWIRCLSRLSRVHSHTENYRGLLDRLQFRLNLSR